MMTMMMKMNDNYSQVISWKYLFTIFSILNFSIFLYIRASLSCNVYTEKIALIHILSWYQSGWNPKNFSSIMAEDCSSSMINNQSNNTQNNFDASSPYTLHASDNYPTWHRVMTIALHAKNKFGFVNGYIIRPTFGSKEEP